jgi:hypothetical protein
VFADPRKPFDRPVARPPRDVRGAEPGAATVRPQHAAAEPDRTAGRRADGRGDPGPGGYRLRLVDHPPAFDRAGNLYVTDIPFGRIFRVDAGGGFTLVAEYVTNDANLLIPPSIWGTLTHEAAAGRCATVLR